MLNRGPSTSIRPGEALRRSLRNGYGLDAFRGDLSAGLVVGIVAVPLSMALAVASGIPPQHGLYTAIVAGVIVALLGGSRRQVTGPTAGFVVILVPLTMQFGLAGLLIATAMAGLIQMMMAAIGAGRLIQYVPYVVTTGFTSGIAIVLVTLQVRDFFGLELDTLPHNTPERVVELARSLPTVNWADVAIGVLTLLALIYWPRRFRRIPAPLAALVIGGVAAWLSQRLLPGVDLATIRSEFGTDDHPHGIPQVPPLPQWPWQQSGPEGAGLVLNFETMRELVLAAIAIAILGAIESLLSALAADGMSDDDHDPDAELFAQGAGNLLVPFFGGIPATGSIARTSANIRHGARSPIAAVAHGVFILGAVLLLAPLLGFLPMAALAALLVRVAWNMSGARHFVHVVRVAPRSDVLVLLVCFGLTMLFDMVVAVTVGVVLAALLFMRRMAETANVTKIDNGDDERGDDVPPGVLVYEVAGPMFFGAAHKAMSTIRADRSDAQIVVIDMRSVPVLDMTGLVNLESALNRLVKQNIYVVLGGVQRQPLEVMARAGLRRNRRQLISVFRSMKDAMWTTEMMSQLLVRPDRLRDRPGRRARPKSTVQS